MIASHGIITSQEIYSFMDSFLDPTNVPMRNPINKLDFVPDRIVAGFAGVFRNDGVVVRASHIPLSCSLILSCIGLPISPMFLLIFFAFFFFLSGLLLNFERTDSKTEDEK